MFTSFNPTPYQTILPVRQRFVAIPGKISPTVTVKRIFHFSDLHLLQVEVEDSDNLVNKVTIQRRKMPKIITTQAACETRRMSTKTRTRMKRIILGNI